MGSIQTFSDMLKYTLRDGLFQDVCILLGICVTFEISNADCEGEFDDT
jgi:hypothetical protein